MKELFFTYKKYITVGFLGALFVALVFYASAIKPPRAFPVGQLIDIPEGVSIREAGIILQQQKVILSGEFFSFLILLYGDDAGVRSGIYEFERPLSIFGVTSRVLSGNTGSPLVRVTFPEGLTVRQMATTLESTLPHFDTERFLEEALLYEGFLFPDTYLFSPNVKPERIVSVMREAFDEKVASIEEEINAFGRSMEEVVTMASILEREARRYETKQIVAGILWKREREGILLQVDAVFGYIFERETFNPTFDDLEVDSPYNTYKNPGLPPGPIANPGIDSIKAAVNPIETKYYYYLTGADGRMHYARTFDEHVANRRFLR
ncbi:endolytic transglycosylase MltG [Candidatus Kaiserbacteria bacterium CG10_big_fil_rev_8_21_14_0_10_45_20]|uniref:Endolytic murein transglycosylase n=1 Tax=Candidatus Kaiserbacteria bacterium CG10_big_fil_rev_8_21_14_0_10_45_20 TaxID=1974607 RepID=A0A2H0UGN0_9BACT|nr:MAG: endolytic transglycosylase MltG [Candidatus Kaiserbacteria bacterium CG10_big_fil_rev_8_21_14_0_10_45_20]